MLSIDNIDLNEFYTDEQITQFLTAHESWSDEDILYLYSLGDKKMSELRNSSNAIQNILRFHRVLMPRIQDMINRRVGPFASLDS